MKLPRPPFSMKRAREAQNRSFGAQEGWIKRRVSSENEFPFSRRTFDISRIKRKPQHWGWVEYAAIAVMVGGLAVLVWALD